MQFIAMQDCFKAHPEVFAKYAALSPTDDDDDDFEDEEEQPQGTAEQPVVNSVAEPAAPAKAEEPKAEEQEQETPGVLKAQFDFQKN